MDGCTEVKTDPLRHGEGRTILEGGKVKIKRFVPDGNQLSIYDAKLGGLYAASAAHDLAKAGIILVFVLTGMHEIEDVSVVIHH